MNRRSFFISLSLCLSAFQASGQNQTGPLYEVSTLADRNNSVAKVGDCTLREAIRAANAAGQPAVIRFAANLKGTITLSATFGQLNVTQPLTLLGAGARNLTVSSGGTHRVFKTTGGPHHFSGLTIQGGKASLGGEGGGAVWNTGTLTMTDCSLTGNRVESPDRFPAKGGAVFTSGNLTLIRCSLNGNVAKGADATTGTYGEDGYGGAIHNADDGSFTAIQCTFSGNTGTGGNGSVRKGMACGAIHNEGSMSFEACTISANTGTGGARFDAASFAIGGIFNEGGSCTMTGTVVAGNTATGFAAHKDVRGSFSSGGYNFIGAVTGFPAGEYPVTGFNQATDTTGTDTSPKDAKLSAFANNGGPTNTMLPAADSLLIDKGKGVADWRDQRGYPRVVDDGGITNAAGGDGTDIGAAEFGAKAPDVVTFIGDTARVFLKGDPGRSYQFEYDDDLVAPWTPLSGEVMMADGTGGLIFLDPGPLPDRRFYRAVRQ